MFVQKINFRSRKGQRDLNTKDGAEDILHYDYITKITNPENN